MMNCLFDLYVGMQDMVDIDLDRLVIFDLETTGLESDCKIVQIAITRGERIYQSLVNPGMPIPPESTEIHRIKDEDVADAPVFGDIVDEVLEIMAGGVLSGFNIRRFDVPVLKREVNLVGKKLPPLPILDLFELTNGTIGPEGYEQLNLPLTPVFSVFFFQSLSFSQGLPIPTSNCQEALLVP